MSKNKCRFCGVEAGKYAFRCSYPCGSWHDGAGEWRQDDACRNLGEKLRAQHEKTIESLRQRIDAAVKALQGIPRCEVYADDQFGIYDERNEHGEWVPWLDVEDVVEILTGNSPTNLESSER